MFVDFFKNRQFLAMLGALVFMLALVFFPDLPFSEEQTIMFFGLLAVYVVGEGFEGKRIIENWKQLMGSRKFLAVVAGLIIVVVQAYRPDFPISVDKLTELFVVLAGLILGAGAEGLKES